MFQKLLLYFFLGLLLNSFAVDIVFAQTAYTVKGQVLGKNGNSVNAIIETGVVNQFVSTDSAGRFELAGEQLADTIYIKGSDIATVLIFLENSDTLTFDLESSDFQELLALSIEDLMNVKIKISSLSEEDLMHSSSTVSFIDKKMIESFGFRTVSEALNYISGIGVFPTYHRYDLTTSRGILQNQYGNKVLILINGVPQWEAVTGATNVNRISIHHVERIEVLKGPASVIYGSNAFSGAINIVYKQTDQENISLHSEVGSVQSFGTGAHYMVKDSNINLFVGALTNYSKGKAYKWRDIKQVNGALYPSLNDGNLNMQLIYKKHKVLINGFFSDQVFFGAGPEWKWGAGKILQERGNLLNYEFQFFDTDKLNLQGGFTYDWYSTDFSRSETDSIRNRWSGTRLVSYLKSYLVLNNHMSVEFGLDGEFRRAGVGEAYIALTDSIYGDLGLAGKSTSELALFTQIRYSNQKLRGVLGTRFTQNQYFGSNFSSRLTFQYLLSKRNSLKVVAGQSYRAPSLFETHVYSPSGLSGNKQLKPERSNSIELVYTNSFKWFYLQALYYYAEYYNRVSRMREGTITTYVNSDFFKANGFEFEAKYLNERVVNVFASAAYVIGEIDDSDPSGERFFDFMPNLTYSSGLSKQIKNITIASTVNGWGTNKAGYEGKYTLDAVFGIKNKVKNASITHTISVKNIFDKPMLFPEYIRGTEDLIGIPTENGYYRRVYYTLVVNF